MLVPNGMRLDMDRNNIKLPAMNPDKTLKNSKAPIKRGHGLNVYNADQINAAGGIVAFNELIGNDKPIEAPNIEFTDEEWKEMERILKQG
jgi:hypothetical protein